MRKKQQNNSLFGLVLSKNRNLDENIDKVKTTNINILLNRVRLDKKKALKKKVFFNTFINYSNKLFDSLLHKLVNKTNLNHY